MGQEEVLEFLKGNKGVWFTSRDLGKATGLTSSSIHRSLGILRYARFVKYKIVDGRGSGTYFYQHKR